MRPKYVTQVLIKQVKIDPYSAKYIVDLLIQEETSKWKSIFNYVLYELIKYPQIKPIYSDKQLLYIFFCNIYHIMDPKGLSDVSYLFSQQLLQQYYDTSLFTTDFTYYKFMKKIKYNILKQLNEAQVCYTSINQTSEN